MTRTASGPVVDPSGKDIILLGRDSAQPGFGHAGILVGNDKTGWTYLSYENRNPPIQEIKFPTLNNALESNLVKCEGRDFQNYAYFKTSPTDDIAVLNAAAALNKIPFDLLTHNCQTSALAMVIVATGDLGLLADLDPLAPKSTVAKVAKKADQSGRWKIDPINLPPDSRPPQIINPYPYPGYAPRYNQGPPGTPGFYPGNAPRYNQGPQGTPSNYPGYRR